MLLVRAMILIFSTYTRIPAPQAKWDDEAMKFAIAFLPLVGAVMGGMIWIWQTLCRYFKLSSVLFAAITVALPIWVTGGIHMDGYCDTLDALASWRDKERRLEILKDPKVGAFAVIRFGVYVLVSFALLYELAESGYDAGIGFTFILSRCFAAWSAITMAKAKKNGMLAAFTEKTDRKKAGITLALLTALGAVGWAYFTFPYGLFGIAFCLPVTLWYRGMAKKHFGGVTGDTTGYYLQTVELTLLAGLLIGGVVLTWRNFF